MLSKLTVINEYREDMKNKVLRIFLMIVAIEIFVTVAFVSWDIFNSSSALMALLGL